MARLLCLGDSIMWGVTGFDAAHPRANPTIPDKIGQLLGVQVDNKAISATSVNDGNNSLVSLLSTVNFNDYDYVLLGYGANDWGLNHETLDALRAGLNMFSSMFNASGGKAYVLVDLMIESFINNATSLNSPNQIGVTQNQVMDTFKSWAIENNYHYYDWRKDPIVTPQNYKMVLGDGCLHPDNATQQKMAERLANYIKATANVPSKPDTQPTQPDTPDTPITPDEPVQPDKPVQPVAPTVKQISELKIDRLSDLFGIGTNVSKGTDAIIAKLNEVYQATETYVGTDSKKVHKILTSPGNTLERPLRNYVVLSFQDLERSVNELIKLCNSNWIVDPQSGNKTDLVTLLHVDSLVTDSHYKDQVNYNWYLIEQVINKLISYLNLVLKGE